MRQRCSLKKQCVNPTKHENSHHKRRAETRHKTKGKEHPHQKQASQRDKERAKSMASVIRIACRYHVGDNDPHRLVLRSGSHIFDSYTHNRHPYTFNRLALCLHLEA